MVIIPKVFMEGISFQDFNRTFFLLSFRFDSDSNLYNRHGKTQPTNIIQGLL